MSIEIADGEGAPFNYSKNLPAEQDIANGRVILRTGSNSQLFQLMAGVLKELCHETQTIRFGGSKKKLLKRLFAYVSLESD